MATLSELADAKVLVRLRGGLDEDEQPIRFVLVYPHVREWLRNLGQLEADFKDSALSPLEQADELLHDFVSGEDLSYYERSHSMTPTKKGVWELKTPDLRLFGWFPRKGAFIVAEADTAFRCKEHNLYAGYRDSVVRRREELPLDEPKFVFGGYADVL